MHTGGLVFDVKILRTFTTYQFTDRLMVRNILEHNTRQREGWASTSCSPTASTPGTAFYIGYDDRLQEGIYLDKERFYNPRPAAAAAGVLHEAAVPVPLLTARPPAHKARDSRPQGSRPSASRVLPAAPSQPRSSRQGVTPRRLHPPVRDVTIADTWSIPSGGSSLDHLLQTRLEDHEKRAVLRSLRTIDSWHRPAGARRRTLRRAALLERLPRLGPRIRP